MPKILLFDLETSGANSLMADLSSIVCFGYKWVGSKSAQVLTIDQFPNWFSKSKGLNDKPLVQAALKLMGEADIVVGHYGDRFDKPYFAGRCVIHGLTPPPPTKMRDTWYIAYKTFKFSSNRLAHLADILKLKQKKMPKKCPEGWPGWWLRSLAGDRKAIKDMAEYCRQDVETLEELYLRLQPFDAAHPRLVADRAKCAACGGEIQYRGVAVAKENKYRRFQCKSCGRWGKDTKKI